jgi:hypothetical protein
MNSNFFFKHLTKFDSFSKFSTICDSDIELMSIMCKDIPTLTGAPNYELRMIFKSYL